MYKILAFYGLKCYNENTFEHLESGRKAILMNVELIKQAQIYVKNKFENEFSGHDYFHTLRVFNMATHIAECEGAKLEIV